MTLDEMVQQRIANWTPPGEGRQTLAFLDPDSETAVQLAVEHKERLGCALWELTVSRSDRSVAAGPALADWAKLVADRVSGLMEPLKLLEIDDALGTALLRSDEPAVKVAGRFYYEVALRRSGTALVRRFRGATEAAPRQQVEFALTNEAIGKLVADLAVA